MIDMCLVTNTFALTGRIYNGMNILPRVSLRYTLGYERHAIDIRAS